ncbi:MAG: TerC family protein [Legionellaceae bacterium]|nr:TerC family protein [Legionellaceae bacterium]
MQFLDILISLLMLTGLEIILGIDNLVFLTLIVKRLPEESRKKARFWGLTFAWVTRLTLLASAVWIVHMTTPILHWHNWHLSVRDIFLLVGGLFLLVKATQEIHGEVLHKEEQKTIKRRPTTVSAAVVQIGIMDIIFSLDSVLTAIGLTTQFWVMASAITISIWVMLYASVPVAKVIEQHPSMKMLALNFLILVAVLLIADGFSLHIPRSYVYFSMAFALLVEGLNLLRKRMAP